MTVRSVLSVEDSDTDFMALQFALNAAGVNVPLTRCATGREAMTWMENAPSCDLSERTSLVLMDLNLPGIDGLQLLKAVRQRDPKRQVPVIVLTTSSHPRDIASCYEAGADAYLTKPLALEDWESKVGSLTEYWLTAAAGKSGFRPVGHFSGSDAASRHETLARTIEREVIPRLLLAHETDAHGSGSGGLIGNSFTPGEDVVAELARLVLEADVATAARFVESVRGPRTSIDSIFQQLITPASRLVGDLWKTDHCSFLQFSQALERLQQLLVELDLDGNCETRH
ncbi:MAG: response regulator [Hyphomicrobiaceae bacterium]|nr:response regulator [Hyphomicrobiaceae bacterium]